MVNDRVVKFFGDFCKMYARDNYLAIFTHVAYF